ncbi:hypothetical protein PBY51_006359 [Eleginops maclovinus]|uniref:Kinesin motor domain-containing protein n=1 Tax=Eleginops maclovinus TaxID=56733 RepID=A0AAN7X425_ELEMC|nr:hypothetical protein PBY51_006359 [Eleginops maclovinus]
MIAHISDSPLNYMETLTTVQLASRIHCMRKKNSKNASSSSGGDSSCEEGPSHRPPHPRPLHPKIVALAPDTPLLLSSDPDYSSSSEHSCDTVIYVGPGGVAISDRELSDNEGPPSFIPIVPSLNKKRVKDAPRADGQHLKCNTFAELQERLDCIDGSDGPATLSPDAKANQAVLRIQAWYKPTEATSPPKSEEISSPGLLESTTTSTTKPDQDQSEFPSASRLVKTSNRTSAAGEKPKGTTSQSSVVKQGGAFSRESEPVVREKTYFRGGVPKPSACPSLPRTSRETSQPAEVVGTTPPVGMSQQALRHGQPLGSPNMERAHNLQAALLGRCLNRDFLRTMVTLQQPVELNGEDELVFTFVEELPLGLVPDNSRPSNLLSFNSDCSLRASRPVSIISSINDEYDAYTCLQGAVEPGDDAGTVTLSQHDGKQSTAVSWPIEGSADSAGSEDPRSPSRPFLRDRNISPEFAPLLTSPSVLHRLMLQPGFKSSLNDSGFCFSELDSDPATPNKHSFTKSFPSPTSIKASLKVRASTLNPSVTEQIPHHAADASLPRKNMPTPSTAVDCSRQEDRHSESLLLGGSHFHPTEFLSEGKPPRSGTSTVSSKRPGGSSIPRPPKAQIFSSAHRVVDGCEKSNSRRGETLIRLPRLTRGATSLGTISVPQTCESRWGHEGPSLTGTLRFLSLGKKSHGQKSNMFFKSGSRNTSPAAPLVRQSNQDLQTAHFPSSEFEKSSFPKNSTSGEELNPRLQAESFSHRSLKTEHSPARMSSSPKTHGAKAESGRHYGSLVALERGNVLNLSGSRQNSAATLGGDSTLNRHGDRASTPASSPQVPPVFSITSKQGQVKGNGSPRAAVPGGTKVRTLSTSSKSLSSSPKPLGNEPGCNTSLPPTGKSLTRLGAGASEGHIEGTKQALSRAANSRVSELATGGQRKQLSRGPEGTGSGGTDSRTSSVSGLPNNSPLPSPYSKITAPRRQQRYSSGHGSGHGSDNSSILSGELPPAMGRTALFYHSGGSSGYESMIRDSETTGSTSSTHDSMSESGLSKSNRSRVSKSPKKRGNGFLRRRLIPAPLPDPSLLGRRAGGQWADQKEPFEIKVYEIDDMQRHQRRREAEPFHHMEEGLIYFNGRLRMLEKQQQQIRELSSKHRQLKEELEEAKSRLSLPPAKWTGQFEVDQDLDRGSQEFLEALLQTTEVLQDCVSLCKSRVMMETCFDVAAQDEQWEVGV